MRVGRLDAGLLARKGDAGPLAHVYEHPMQRPLSALLDRSDGAESVDQRGTASPRASVPAQAHDRPAGAVLAEMSGRQRRPSVSLGDLARAGGAEPPEDPAPTRRQPAEGRGPAHLSIRLDRGHHRDLRILAARRQCSLQRLVGEAIERYLADESNDCPCMRGDPCACGEGR